MEMELKDIINKIKEEGVTEAEKKADEIISEAEGKAKNTVEAAEKEKAEIIKRANKEAEKLQKNGEEAIRQSARDVLLGLRENIIALFDKVMKKDIAEQLSPEVMKEMIARLADSIGKKEGTGVEVLLSEKDEKILEELIIGTLKREAKKGITLKVNAAVEHGFRIGEKGGNTYYDFTDDAIAEAFKSYLNQQMIQILTPGAETE